MAVAWLALGLAACSVGGGEGEIGGTVVATDFCALEATDYQLVPSFFSAELVEGTMSLRVQRGSQLEQFADGLMIVVRDVNDVKERRIGLPIPLDGDWRSPVQITLYLNASCEAGFPNEHRRRAVLMEAVGGTITFDAIYAPDIAPGDPGIEAELDQVIFVDSALPEQRHATLSGRFSFFYQRGAPAQRFP